MTCEFMPCLRCLPEQKGRSAAILSGGEGAVEDRVGALVPQRRRSFGFRAVISATVSVTCCQAVAALIPNPAAISANGALCAFKQRSPWYRSRS